MEKISRLVKELDEETRQVFIETEIAEVTLSDDFQKGIDWEKIFSARSLDGLDLAGYFPLTFAAAYQKIAVGTLATNRYSAVIKFLETYGDTKIISQPRIAAVNNEEASIMVGTREAYVTQTLSQAQTTTVTSESIEFVDVGVKLKIIPTINKEGFINMKIKPEVSSVKEIISTSLGSRIPIVQTSQAETVVKVKDGTMIMIAGLIREENTDTVNRVPWLGKMPVIGPFFGNREKTMQRTELVIFITPHLIRGNSALPGYEPENIIPHEIMPESVKRKIVRESEMVNSFRLPAKKMQEELIRAEAEKIEKIKQAEEIKKEDEARKLEEAKKLEQDRKLEEAKKAEMAQKAEQVRKLEEIKKQEESEQAAQAEAKKKLEQAKKQAEAEKLEKAKKSAEAKKAEQANKQAEEARKKEEIKKAEDEKIAKANKAEEIKKAAEAGKLEEARNKEAIKKQEELKKAEELKLKQETKKLEEINKLEEARKKEETKKAEAKKKLEQAKKQAEAEKLEKAKKAEKLRKPEQIKKPPEAKAPDKLKAAGLYQKGLDAQKSNNLNEAKDYFQNAIVIDPGFAIAYNQLGIILETSGLSDEAERMYLKTLEIDPKCKAAYSNLALLNEAKGNTAKAIEYWRKRAQLGEPSDPWAKEALRHIEQQTQAK
jgi:hypothetical protein